MELRYEDLHREMDFTGVFLITPEVEVRLMLKHLTAPNGIGLSPDENKMYVANSGGRTGFIWMEYEVEADGSLQNEKLFCDARSAADMCLMRIRLR